MDSYGRGQKVTVYWSGCMDRGTQPGQNYISVIALQSFCWNEPGGIGKERAWALERKLGWFWFCFTMSIQSQLNYVKTLGEMIH